MGAIPVGAGFTRVIPMTLKNGSGHAFVPLNMKYEP